MCEEYECSCHINVCEYCPVHSFKSRKELEEMFCAREERRYVCEDLKDIEGFPGCSEGCNSGRKTKMDLGPNQKFLVCAKVGGWLLSRGVPISEMKHENFDE